MKRRLALGLVAAQFVLLAALAFLPHGQLWPVNAEVFAIAVVLGLFGATLAVLGVVGLGPALTASPIPRENAPLVTSGVFGLVRSPIYSGLMAGGLGLALVGASVWHVVAWVGLVVLLSPRHGGKSGCSWPNTRTTSPTARPSAVSCRASESCADGPDEVKFRRRSRSIPVAGSNLRSPGPSG